MKSFISLFLFCLFLISPPAFGGDDPLTGLWATEGNEAVVQIYSCDDGTFCGRFYQLKDEDYRNPSRDTKNPDPMKRKQLLCGLEFFGGFKPKGAGDYGSGWLYSPRHGSRFSASIQLNSPNELRLRGYFLLPLFGESQVWTRVQNIAACPF